MGGCSSKKISRRQSVDSEEKQTLENSNQHPHMSSTPRPNENNGFSKDQDNPTSSASTQQPVESNEGHRGRVLDSPTSPTMSTQSSRLEESQRRRLSVSTISRVGEGDSFILSDPKERSSSKPLPISLVTAKTFESDVTKPDTESETLAVVESPSSGKRSLIKKFPDPALELLNEATGTIREVTVSMLLGLFEKSNKSFLIFGAPSLGIQRGFDNKRSDILGTLAPSYNLAANGIGYACKKGLKPESPNQDDFFIVKVDDWAMYGVFDGHGPYGHDVSSFVHKVLPFLIFGDMQFDSDPLLVLRRSFRKVHHLLEAMCDSSDHLVDCSLSGTTGTIVLHRDNKLYVAHVGDSRSVLSRKNGDRIKAINLTTDHKPTCEEERKRIENNGGEVRRLEGDIPYRVFVKNKMYPGLAMSRAIGDTVGAAVGVVPDPDVKMVELKEEDQFLIISTDGVWEFISSQEAVDFVCQKKRNDVQKAAEFLAYESWRRWVEEEENVVDDVTCLIIYVSMDKTITDN